MEDDSPSISIKKRSKKGATRSSIGSPSILDGSSVQTEDGDLDEGSSVVLSRNRLKKTPTGRVIAATASFKGKSRLSFGSTEEDHEGEASTSSAGKKRSLLRQPLSLSREDLPSFSEQAASTSKSVYNPAYLDELKAATQSTPKSQSNHSDLVKSKFGTSALEKYDVEEAELEASIPTTNAIAAAKMKRELVRKMGTEVTDQSQDASIQGDGYISLDVGHASKGGESRLMREDDELGSGDEDLADFTGSKESIPLGSKARKKSEQKRKEGILELINDVEDEFAEQDEEAMEWENAQVRRGARFQEEVSQSTTQAYRSLPTLAELFGSVPPTSNVPSLASVQTRLKGALADLQSSHKANQAFLDSGRQEVQDLDQQETDLRNEVERVSRKLEWFQGTRSWVADVVAFLDEKFPALEKIELENIGIQKERFEIIARRRYLDDADDLSLFTGAPVTTDYDLLGKETDDTEDDAELKRIRNEMLLEPRSAIRETRRVERTMRFSKSQSRLKTTADDGFSTDDDLVAEDYEDMLLASTRVQESTTKLFSDVKAEEFKDPELGILPKFKEWRALHEEEYSKSYGGLVMCNVWEFWARVEMALWNPFAIPQLPTTNEHGFEGFRWHQVLTDYSHHHTSQIDGTSDRPRFEEENALAPAYDPLSSSGTTNALRLVEEVTYCLDRQGRKFEMLIQSIFKQIAAVIQRIQQQLLPYIDAVTSPLHAMSPDCIQARHRYGQRLTKLVMTSLRWRSLAKGVTFPIGFGYGLSLDMFIAQELVEKCLLPIVEAGGQIGQAEIAEKTLSLFTKAIDPLPSRIIVRLNGS